MIGTTKCPQVRSAISVANIYCHELGMRVFNSQLKVTEIEMGSYLNPAASRSNRLVQLCEIEIHVPSHCRETIIHNNTTFDMCAKADTAQIFSVTICSLVPSNHSLVS
jgi:hypothetical protein